MPLDNFFTEIAAIAAPVGHTIPDLEEIYDRFLDQGKIPHVLLNEGNELFDSMYKTKPQGIVLYHVLIVLVYNPENFKS
jgi:hypothetical protein